MERNLIGNPITRREFVRTAAVGAAGAFLTFGAVDKALGRPAEDILSDDLYTLPELPYAQDALEPHISARTMSFHYGKHHAGYVAKANRFVRGSKLANIPVEKLITETAGKPESTSIFNNVAQMYNHTFFWNSMKPKGGRPKGEIARLIVRDFEDIEHFVAIFIRKATMQFGSGWEWLVIDKGKLKVMTTANADNPLTHGMTPLLTLDVWEHAYYLDYQNRRADFAKAYVLNLVNWDFAEENLKKI